MYALAVELLLFIAIVINLTVFTSFYQASGVAGRVDIVWLVLRGDRRFGRHVRDDQRISHLDLLLHI